MEELEVDILDSKAHCAMDKIAAVAQLDIQHTHCEAVDMFERQVDILYVKVALVDTQLGSVETTRSRC